MTRIYLVKTIEKIFNMLELSGIAIMLILAFAFQIIFHELPCPLCLLQRLGFLGVALGFLMNLRFGLRPSHYAISLFSALFTSFVALRQIALHVVPGTGTYGDAILGLHLYTWSFIISMAIVLSTTIMMGFDRQYQTNINNNKHFKRLTDVFFAVIVLLLVANITSVFMVCGFSECPENPI